MTASSSAVLNIARAELGTSENPHGSNKVKYNTWYYGREVSGGSYPWCAVSVSWVAAQAGATDIIPKHAFTPNGAQWFKARGAWHSSPQVGDIVYYQWPGMERVSHVGIVEAVHGDGSFTAIEGNTDGGGSRTGGIVMRQLRSKVGGLGGFGRPAYGASAAPQQSTPAAQPSSSGRNIAETKATQAAIHRNADGDSGDDTDNGVNLVRAALNGQFPQGKKAAQVAVGTKADGAWGPNSKAALKETVRELQVAWGVDNSSGPGIWGPRTEAAYQAARARNYKKY